MEKNINPIQRSAGPLSETKKILLLCVTAVLISSVMYIIYGAALFRFYGDSRGFLDMLSHFQKNDFPKDFARNIDLFVRLQRPMQVALAYPFSYIFSNVFSFYFINSVFYILNGLLLYALYNLLFSKKEYNIIPALLYYCNVIPLHFGFSVLAETCNHFFYLLNLYFIIKDVFLQSKLEFKPVIKIALFTSLGFFIKENMVAVFVFLGWICLYKRFPIKKVIMALSLSFLTFIIPVILWQLFIYITFDFTILDWFRHHYQDTVWKNKLSLFRLFLSLGTAFNLLLIPFLLYLIRSRKFRSLALGLLIAGLLIPVISVNLIDRIVFQVFPALFLFTSYYCFEEKDAKYKYLYLALYICFNIGLLILYRQDSVYYYFYNIFLKNRI
ncbi:MAG: hypothetical protein PHF84_09200 [bacterium]|nr:hypothetical protein [bacterium]